MKKDRLKSKIKQLKRQLEKIISRPSYTIPYTLTYISYLQSKFIEERSKSESSEEYDLVFVVLNFARGWVLEAICREIATYFPGKYCFHYSESSLPPSKAYFFAHYSFLPVCLKQNPSIWGSQLLVWHTHPRDDLGFSNDELIYVLNKATKVICACSKFARLLVSQGVKPDKVTYILGAADPKIFQPHQRTNGAVGFCTAFYYRKEPERIFNIIKMMPHRKFIILGRGWQKYEKFTEMSSWPHFTYVEAPYSDYPKYYEQMDVFVSPAKLEGGPIPLVESMMCNVVPVASNTGFAPDLIVDEENGFLFDVDSSCENICALIEKAFSLKADVRKTVEHLNWNQFSQNIQEFLVNES